MIARLSFDDTLDDAISKQKEGPVPLSDAENDSANGETEDRETRFVRDDKPEFVGGRMGRALKFDGKMHLNLATAMSFDSTNAFSYGAWVKIEGDGAVLSKMEPGPGYRGFDLFVSDKRFEVHLAHQYPDDAIKLKTKNQFGGGWRHVLVTYDGSKKAAGVRVYVDGKPSETDIEKDALKGEIINGEVVRVGSRSGSGNFKGVLDDLRIYDRELTSEDARLLAFDGMMTILRKSRGNRSDEERRDLARDSTRRTTRWITCGRKTHWQRLVR